MLFTARLQQRRLFQPRTELRIGDRAFSVAAPRAWNRLPSTELKLKLIQAPSELCSFSHHVLWHHHHHHHHHHYVMHLQADCRRRTTNYAVTVTVRFYISLTVC